MTNGLITATRLLGFDAAHRVLRHESKCSNLHGHRYTAEVTCRAPALDEVGRVIDFGVMKGIVGKWIDDHLDHTTIVGAEDASLVSWCVQEARDHGKRAPYIVPFEPTAENLAGLIFRQSALLLHDTDVRIHHVRLWETPNCFADYHAPQAPNGQHRSAPGEGAAFRDMSKVVM